MSKSPAERAIERIVEVMYPAADPDAEWDSETIEWVAEALADEGFGPVAEERADALDRYQRDLAEAADAVNRYRARIGQGPLPEHWTEDDIFEEYKRIKKNPEVLAGGVAAGMSPCAFDARALAEGIQVELEHTDSSAVAQEIAMDHLAEDPAYYRKLRTIHNESREELKRRLMR